MLPRLSPGPEYAYYDPVGMEFWARLDEDFPDYQTALLDDGQVVAKGCSIPHPPQVRRGRRRAFRRWLGFRAAARLR
jgi:hypothetical protein